MEEIKQTKVRKLDLIKRLIERSIFSTNDKMPGSLIKKLPIEDRELCKLLKSEDFNNRIW